LHSCTFWCVLVRAPARQDRDRIAWFVGLVMDAGTAPLLGQHAFAYAFLGFRRRQPAPAHSVVLGRGGRAAHVLVLLLASQLLMLAGAHSRGRRVPGIDLLRRKLRRAALWPTASFCSSCRSEAAGIDENRPI